MEPAIQVEGLSKRYLLGGRRSGLLQRLKGRGGDAREPSEFWALRDVSFQIGRGEVVGIIGRNGAGKSTLLKILSRITSPTTGRALIRGRVASLLEVGTGFHPELSGRDNIFLNGAILGLSSSDIRARFDEIVDFSEIERFIDTPVKHYSSGMYVRLAFAVAAHLEPEILIIDEVLAVGDTAFQKKCIGKIRSISRTSERTVLFISHDMSAISALTQRCLFLSKGSLVRQGPTSEIVSAYQESIRTHSDYQGHSKGDDRPYVASVSLECSHPHGVQVAGQGLRVTIVLRHPKPVRSACLSLQVMNQLGQPATHAWFHHCDAPYADVEGSTTLTCVMPRIRLNVGEYSLRIFFSEPPGGEIFDDVEGACPFRVINDSPTSYFGWRPEFCVYHEEASWTLTRSEK
jgi:lipopolysaccharide transport system ATP-binding protein